jgi:hypothetical protein
MIYTVRRGHKNSPQDRRCPKKEVLLNVRAHATASLQIEIVGRDGPFINTQLQLGVEAAGTDTVSTVFAQRTVETVETVSCAWPAPH